jgi:hypothetical protein
MPYLTAQFDIEGSFTPLIILCLPNESWQDRSVDRPSLSADMNRRSWEILLGSLRSVLTIVRGPDGRPSV